ncbi:hypothetical protein [Streptomyces sp. NPDC056255]
MDWLERARAAEQLQEWDVAIALVSAHAECFSEGILSRYDGLVVA